jgi:Ca2+-binding EF-hand superfamily protein
MQPQSDTVLLKKIVAEPTKMQRIGDPLIDNFRAAVLKRSGRAGFRGLVCVLRRLDDNGDRKLSLEEITGALTEYGLEHRPQDVDRLFKTFDRDRSGSISVTEFVRALRPAVNMARRDLVTQAYAQLDRNGDGVVPLGEVSRLYDTARHPEVLAGAKTAEEVMIEFTSLWDRDGDHVITASEFLDYYSDLSAGIDNDVYFELMIRNAWHLSGGTGAAQNTTCLRVLVVFEDRRQAVVEVRNDLGMDATDLVDIRKRLTQQGVKMIAEIHLSSAPQ